MFPVFHKVTVAGSFLLYMATTVFGGMLYPVLSQHRGCLPGQQSYATCCQPRVQSARDSQLATENTPSAMISSPPTVCLFCQLLATPQLCYFGTSFDRPDDLLDESRSSVAINQPLQPTSEYHPRAPPKASS